MSPDWADLRQLRYFVTLVEHATYARAAQTLGITQSALTQSIARLEARVGARLFDRGRFGATITDAGRLLLPRAKLIVAESQLALSEMQSTRGASRGRISIGVGKSVASTLIPEAIARTLQVNPDIQIITREGWSPDLYQRLLQGDLDFVVSAPLPGIAVDLDLRQEPLFEQPEAVVIGRRHPLAVRADIALADLVDQLWLTPPPGNGRLQTLQRIFQDHGLDPPMRFLRSDSIEIGLSMLRRGLVVTQSMVDIVMAALPPEDYRILAIPEMTLQRQVSMTSRKRSRLQSAAALLANEIRAIAHEAPRLSEWFVGAAGLPKRG